MVWQQVGLEFCTNVTYDAKEPDLLISSLSNAYRVLNCAKGQWKLEGTLFDNSPFAEKARLASQSSGTPRIIELNGRRYYYSMSGNQIKVFRMNQEMKLATWVGNGEQAWNATILGPMPAKEKRQRASILLDRHERRLQGAAGRVDRHSRKGGWRFQLRG